jgi:predicted DNA-binding protein
MQMRGKRGMMTNRLTMQTAIRMALADYRALEAIARAEDRTVSSKIRVLIAAELTKHRPATT